jgi:hypothetical protein
VRAMAPGVRAVPALSARTFATIARSSPLRNRDTDPPGELAGAVGAAGVGVGVVIAGDPFDPAAETGAHSAEVFGPFHGLFARHGSRRVWYSAFFPGSPATIQL